MGTRDETAFWRVTDAASGVGAAVVRAARYSGTTVLALDIDEVKGLALAKKTGALFRYWDISDMAQDERSRRGRGVWFAVTAAELVPGAAIVVTASLAGVSPYSVDSLYALSKYAVVGLARSLAPELAKRGINIHTLCLGDKTA